MSENNETYALRFVNGIHDDNVQPDKGTCTHKQTGEIVRGAHKTLRQQTDTTWLTQAGFLLRFGKLNSMNSACGIKFWVRRVSCFSCDLRSNFLSKYNSRKHRGGLHLELPQSQGRLTFGIHPALTLTLSQAYSEVILCLFRVLSGRL